VDDGGNLGSIMTLASMRFLPFLLLAAAMLGYAAEPDLLEPEQAFRVGVRLAARDAIEVRYVIAPGYYMYRDKFRFQAEPAEARLGAAELPAGKMRRDEFFGEVETYRDEVTIRLPLASEAGPVSALVATSQGCADAGVCYLPQEQKVDLRLAVVGGAFVEPARASGATPGEVAASPRMAP
jgi:thiol:disulfide interchange protein DsbD